MMVKQNCNVVKVEVRRVARQSKPKNLNFHDHDLDKNFGLLHLHSTLSCSCSSSSPETCYHKSRSRGSSKSGHWSCFAVPQPLPLPESQLTRRPPVETTGLGKILVHGAFSRTKSSSNLDRPCSDNFANAKCEPRVRTKRYNLRVHIPAPSFLTGNSSWEKPTSKSCDDDNDDDEDSESISKLSMHLGAKSAPSSVSASPSRSRNEEFHHIIDFPQQVTENLLMLPSKTVLPDSKHVDAYPLPLPPRVPQASLMIHSVKGQWQKGKLIGHGTFGRVYHATNLETGASCAMKEIDLISDDPKFSESIKQLEQEIRILGQLRHPNVVQYYGSETIGDHLYIYMEYVHPGSINKFIRDHCQAMTESVVRNFTRHILSGLAYLHSTKTIHRDIKGANLLVNESGIVKLADFGMAKILTGNSCELSLKGSPNWMAPELMKAAMKNESNPDFAMAIDIWSLGCTVIEMLTGKPPWSELEGPSAMFKVLHNSPPIPETLSSVGKDFLQQCFRRDPAERPSASMLLKHAFVQNLHDQDVLAYPQLYLRRGQGQGDTSPCSRDNNTKTRSHVMPASMSARIFNKTQKLIRDTSKHYNAEKSHQIITSRHANLPQFHNLRSSLKLGTFNYSSVANSSNIPLTVMGKS